MVYCAPCTAKCSALCGQPLSMMSSILFSAFHEPLMTPMALRSCSRLISRCTEMSPCLVSLPSLPNGRLQPKYSRRISSSVMIKSLL